MTSNYKTFVVNTEKGRIKGKINGYILKVEEIVIHVADFSYSQMMNRGVRTEVVNELVKAGEIPPECLEIDGYINYEKLKKQKINIVIIEGYGLSNYLSMP